MVALAGEWMGQEGAVRPSLLLGLGVLGTATLLLALLLNDVREELLSQWGGRGGRGGTTDNAGEGETHLGGRAPLTTSPLPSFAPLPSSSLALPPVSSFGGEKREEMEGSSARGEGMARGGGGGGRSAELGGGEESRGSPLPLSSHRGGSSSMESSSQMRHRPSPSAGYDGGDREREVRERLAFERYDRDRGDSGRRRSSRPVEDEEDGGGTGGPYHSRGGDKGGGGGGGERRRRDRGDRDRDRGGGEGREGGGGGGGGEEVSSSASSSMYRSRPSLSPTPSPYPSHPSHLFHPSHSSQSLPSPAHRHHQSFSSSAHHWPSAGLPPSPSQFSSLHSGEPSGLARETSVSSLPSASMLASTPSHSTTTTTWQPSHSSSSSHLHSSPSAGEWDGYGGAAHPSQGSSVGGSLAGSGEAFLYTLARGCELVKYGKFGSPHVRWFQVQLVNGLARLSWGEPKLKTGGELNLSKSIKMNDITDVRPGKTTPVFRQRGNDKLAADADKCFSILTHKRSLDLQAKDCEERDQWVAGLRQISHSGHSQSHPPPPNPPQLSFPSSSSSTLQPSPSSSFSFVSAHPPPPLHSQSTPSLSDFPAAQQKLVVTALAAQQRQMGGAGGGRGGGQPVGGQTGEASSSSPSPSPSPSPTQLLHLHPQAPPSAVISTATTSLPFLTTTYPATPPLIR